MTNYKKMMIDSIEDLSKRFKKWTIFSDLLAMGAISYRNAVDKRDWDKREKTYLNIVKKYSKKEMDVFINILSYLALALEVEMTDILGEVYMELEISNRNSGQFFTPMDISDMMAEMTIKGIEGKIKDEGYITLDEPAVGGGATIISFAKSMKKRGYNYQKQLYVNARDIDLDSVHMCYIQLTLLGIPAVIQHGNSMSLEIFDEWITPAFILGRWDYKLKRDKQKATSKTKLNQDDTGQIMMM